MKTIGKREAEEMSKPHPGKVWTSQGKIFGSNRPEWMAMNGPPGGTATGHRCFLLQKPGIRVGDPQNQSFGRQSRFSVLPSPATTSGVSPPAITSGVGPPGESSHQAFTLSPLLMSEMPRNNWERFLREPNNGMHFHPGFIINVCIIYLSWRDYSD